MLANWYIDANLEVYLSLFINLSFHLLVALPLMPLANNLNVMRWVDDIFGEPVEVHGFGRACSTMIISAFGTQIHTQHSQLFITQVEIHNANQNSQQFQRKKKEQEEIKGVRYNWSGRIAKQKKEDQKQYFYVIIRLSIIAFYYMNPQSDQSSNNQAPNSSRPIKKVAEPIHAYDHFIPLHHLDLLYPYYVPDEHHPPQTNTNSPHQINFRTMMEDKSDYGDLPSRKSSISSIYGEDDKGDVCTGNILKTIRKQNQEWSEGEKERKNGGQERKEKYRKRHPVKREQQQQEEYQVKSVISCNCKKNKCQKLSCECLRNSQPCTDICGCFSCQNIYIKVQRKKGNCNCKKTKCQKKYCECFSQGLACGPLCGCSECQNN